MLQELVKNSYCINLERRKDRAEYITCEFNRISLPLPTLFKAIDGRNVTVPEISVKINQSNASSILACMLSHKSVLETFTGDAVCIFEDDIVFCDDFLQRLAYVENSGIEWDMIYLGGHFDGVGLYPTKDKYIYQCKSVAGTYAYIIKRNVADFVLRNITYNWGIDQFYAEVVQKRFNCICFYPFSVGTYDDFSDIANCKTNYDKAYKQFRKERMEL